MFYKDLKREWFRKRLSEYTVYLMESNKGKTQTSWFKLWLFDYNTKELNYTTANYWYSMSPSLNEEEHISLAKTLFKKDPCEAFFNARSISLKTKKIKKENERDYIAVGYRTKKDVKKIQDSKDLEIERYINGIIK